MLMKPRTVCFCQPVSFWISGRVTPLARWISATISPFLLPSRGPRFAVAFLGRFREAAALRPLPALFACGFFEAFAVLAPFVGFPALRAFVGFGALLLAAARG